MARGIGGCHPDHDLNIIGHVSLQIYNIDKFSSTCSGCYFVRLS